MTAGQYEMLVEKNVGIPTSDGLVLRCNVFRPKARGPLSGGHGARRLRQRHSLCRCVQAAMGEAARNLSRPLQQRFDRPISALGDRRSGALGAGRLRRDPGRLARHRPVAWLSRPALAARDAGLLRMYRMGRASRAGRTARLACAVFPTTPSRNGRWRRCSRRILAAICPWEGFVDYYRNSTHHGGIFANGFTTAWWPRQVLSNQYGNANTPHRDRETGERTTGGPALSEAILKGNRADYPGDLLLHPLDDQWYAERTPDPVAHRSAAVIGRQLGRSGPASARQCRGLPWRLLEAEMAVTARRHALGELLSAGIRGDAEALLRPLPQGRE